MEVPAAVTAQAVRRAVARGARAVLNLAPYAGLPPDVVAAADPVVVNEHEALQLADSGMVPSDHGRHVRRGRRVVGRDRSTGPQVPTADVVDTTGAGDAFCGALAAALAGGADRRTALEDALAAGSEAVTRQGAQPDPLL